MPAYSAGILVCGVQRLCGSRLNLGRWQIKRHGGVLKMAFVRAVAKRLLLREAAAADADALAAAQAVGLAFGVNYFDVFALYAEGAIGKNGDFGGHF
jgi:hypothetical protein